jgi:hypothetical protein
MSNPPCGATLCAFEVRYDVPVVFVPTSQEGAAKIERWAFYFVREAVTAIKRSVESEQDESAPLSGTRTL